MMKIFTNFDKESFVDDGYVSGKNTYFTDGSVENRRGDVDIIQLEDESM